MTPTERRILSPDRRAESPVIRQLRMLRERISTQRHEEIGRAIALSRFDQKQAAYHTGVADGKNGIVKELDTIIEMNRLLGRQQT